MNDNKKFWDFTAAFIYDLGHSLEKKSYYQAADNIVKKFNENDKILELSCGTGMLTEAIFNRLDKQVDYTATDFSLKMLNKCDYKVSGMNLELADATDLLYEDKSYDHVIIANALHIMPDPIKALKEIRRVLKDEGTLFAPNFLTPTTLNESIMMGLARKIGYEVFNEFDKEKFIELLVNNGFDVQKMDIYTQYRSLLYTESKKSKQYTYHK